MGIGSEKDVPISRLKAMELIAAEEDEFKRAGREKKGPRERDNLNNTVEIAATKKKSKIEKESSFHCIMALEEVNQKHDTYHGIDLRGTIPRELMSPSFSLSGSCSSSVSSTHAL